MHNNARYIKHFLGFVDSSTQSNTDQRPEQGGSLRAWARAEPDVCHPAASDRSVS